MHATTWRAHPAVPGVALGGFESSLGDVEGLYHTGARHHFSVAWIAPRHRAGVFMVHSMRQGGRFQSLRTTVIREFARRYLPPDSGSVRSGTPSAVTGVYRPLLLSTTTVERLGYLLLDIPVRVGSDGALTLQAPGQLGTVQAVPVGRNLFEVREGPQADLRVGLVAGEGAPMIVVGGTLLDPVVMKRLSWWQRGRVHAILLGGTSLVLTLTGVFGFSRAVLRRRKPDGVTPIVMTEAAGFILALVAFLIVVLTTPEVDAAAHMRAGLHVVLTFLTAAWAGCVAIPVVTVLRWRHIGRSRIGWSLLALSGMVSAVLLWQYRLVGFRL